MKVFFFLSLLMSFNETNLNIRMHISCQNFKRLTVFILKRRVGKRTDRYKRSVALFCYISWKIILCDCQAKQVKKGFQVVNGELWYVVQMATIPASLQPHLNTLLKIRTWGLNSVVSYTNVCLAWTRTCSLFAWTWTFNKLAGADLYANSWTFDINFP